MLGFLAILGATLSGFVGAPVWTIAVAAIALTIVETMLLHPRVGAYSSREVANRMMLGRVAAFGSAVGIGISVYGVGWLLGASLQFV